jgi:predicted dehydrogenase
MKTFVKGKEIGEPFYVKAGWTKSQSSGEKWFLEKEKAGGGVFLDNGIVMLDLGMWMLGFPEPLSVSAVNYYHNTKNVEDSNFTLIKFKNGSTLTVETSWSLQRDGELFYCNVFGKSGSTCINPLRIYKRMDEKLFNITPNKLVMPPNQFKKSYELELQHFVKVINNEADIISSGEEALVRMKIVDAIYKSAKQGKEVIFK